MRVWGLLVIVSMTLGCNAEKEETVCEAMCRELIQICDYAAYPSLESCNQGCTYEADQGADITGQSECILEADCDTFAILECEHEYGADQ